MKWLAFAYRNVLRNKRRTLLSVLIFSAGTAAILSATGFVSASFHGLREATIAGQLGHIQIGAKGQFAGFEKTPMDNGLSQQQASAAMTNAAALPGVRFSMQRVLFEGLIAAGDRTLAVVGSGVEPEQETRLSGVFAAIVDGDSLPVSSEADQNKVIIAVDLARALGVKAGDRVTVLATTEKGVLNAIDLIVSGIYRTGIPELDRRAIMMPLATSQSLLDTQRISRVVVVLNDTARTDAVAQGLHARLTDLEIKRWIDLAPFYQQVVTLYSNIFGVLGAIILIVVLLSVSNAMLMSLFERIREQGTLRAFGIPALRIRQNFLLEGGIVGMIGGISGLLLAIVLALAINFSGIEMPPPPGRTTSYPLLIFIEPTAYGLTLLGMVIVGVLAAALSLISSRRMTILEQLNHN
ncbi:MAG: FtsX-like permease family protein [Pseudomonadota bacterium]